MSFKGTEHYRKRVNSECAIRNDAKWIRPEFYRVSAQYEADISLLCDHIEELEDALEKMRRLALLVLEAPYRYGQPASELACHVLALSDENAELRERVDEMDRKKPVALTPQDWEAIQAFERATESALAQGDGDRIGMLYSKVRYPMCALAEWEQRWNAAQNKN